ncbi:MAG: hypothetical protein ACRDN9_11590 [Streptosporangiaceae bacterium]
MTDIASYLHGIHPRSEDLVGATRDHARGRLSAEAVDDQRQADRAAFRSLQRDAGIDYLSAGHLDWQDLFRPLIAASAGLSPGALTRWFDNNAFFRAPIVDGPPRLDVRRFIKEYGAGEGDGPTVAVLPGPYTFSRASATDGDRDVLMATLASDVLRPAVETSVQRGAALVHLEEPWLVKPGARIDWRTVGEAIASTRDGIDARVVVHTYFGDAGPHLPRLRALPADAIGVDLVETDLADLAGTWEKGLVAGCVDGRTSLVESIDETVAVARDILEIAELPALLLSSTCDLELVPRQVGDQKVRLLGAAAARLREEREE